jgi:hypothetical protein
MTESLPEAEFEYEAAEGLGDFDPTLATPVDEEAPEPAPAGVDEECSE